MEGKRRRSYVAIGEASNSLNHLSGAGRLSGELIARDAIFGGDLR